MCKQALRNLKTCTVENCIQGINPLVLKKKSRLKNLGGKQSLTGLNKMMVKCKTCGHGCHCSEDKIDSEHYTPLMDLCECKKCQHEVKEIEYEECLSCQ